MIDLLFVAFNRRAYTEASLTALFANTDWEQVATLYVHDDESSDGTRRYLRQALAAHTNVVPIVFESHKLGSPVAVMNWYLDQPSGQDAFVKIDNDFVVCPGWLEIVLRTAHLNPGYDALGIAPWEGPPTLTGPREVTLASHIGGVGLIRRRMFKQCRPVPNGRYGWTEHQHNHSFQVGWLKPDMPCFELDRLPVEPWASLAKTYCFRQWSREWPKYESPAYYEWWTNERVAACA